MKFNRKMRRQLLREPQPTVFCIRCGAEQEDLSDGRQPVLVKAHQAEMSESEPPSSNGVAVNEDYFDVGQIPVKHYAEIGPCQPIDCETCDMSVQSWFSKYCKPGNSCGQYRVLRIITKEDYDNLPVSKTTWWVA